MMIFVEDEAASRLVDRNKRAHNVTAKMTDILLPSFLLLLTTGWPFSLDHLIRPEQHRLRDRQADLLGGFQIDYKLKLHWLLHRQVCGLCTFEDLVDVYGGAPEIPSLVGCIGHEAAGFYKVTSLVHG